LETFPVFSGELSGEVAEFGDFVFLELLVEICGGVVLTLLGELGVEFDAAVG